MNYRYFHDPVQRRQYRHNDVPDVFDQESGGKLVGWTVRLVIDVVRADNWLTTQDRWHFATSEYPDEHFDSLRYSRDLAIDLFMQRNSAEGKGGDTEEVNEIAYNLLKEIYNSEAHANRGAARS